MSARYLSFDIETAKVLAEGETLRDARPLGVTCVGLAWQTEEGPRTFALAAKGDKMDAGELVEVFAHLERAAAKGYSVLTWNGMGFDFDVLAEELAEVGEAKLARECAKLAASEAHVDAMLHFFCVKGFRCGLEAACKGMALPGKLEGMNGGLAPVMWQRNAEGDRAKVVEYVQKDAAIQLALGRAADAAGEIRWITKKGKKSWAKMKGGLLSVPRALSLPEPDVSWMNDPANPPEPRSKFTAWVGGHRGETTALPPSAPEPPASDRPW